MKRRSGFTLAEVLITLSIIGVVAALTIPAITGSTNKARATTSIKKAVSIMNQALTMTIAQDGLSANSAANSEVLRSTFQTYLSTLSNDTTSLTTADGMIYTFYKSGAGSVCTSPADNDPDGETNICLVEVDINGSSGSNAVSNKDNYSDLYYLIVRDTDVLPVNTTDFTLPAGFRGSGVLADDVAQDALIN